MAVDGGTERALESSQRRHDSQSQSCPVDTEPSLIHARDAFQQSPRRPTPNTSTVRARPPPVVRNSLAKNAGMCVVVGGTAWQVGDFFNS